MDDIDMPAELTDPGCWWHGPEPIPDDAFLVCPECWHCYPTEQDLIDTNIREWNDDRPTSEIWSCPLCIHDW